MGASISGEGASSKSPRCDVRYLHSLVSDPSKLREVFTRLWMNCGADAHGIAPKSSVISVMTVVMGQFEQRAGTPQQGEWRADGTAARNLEHIAESLPDRMVEADALHLFRTALLSLQASLVVTDQNVARDGFKLGFGDWSYTTAGSSATPSLVASQGRASGSKLSDSSAPSLTAVTSSSATSSAKFEDILLGVSRPRRLPDMDPRIRFLSHRRTLPSRLELERESEQLQTLLELEAACQRDEVNVISTLEEGARPLAQPECAETRDRGREEARSELETKIRASEREVLRFEAKITSKEEEARSYAVDAEKRRLELKAYVERRTSEEAFADEYSRETRDLTSELRVYDRKCEDLESEIASEEACTISLRAALDVRRAGPVEVAKKESEFHLRGSRPDTRGTSEAALEEARSARVACASNFASLIESLRAELGEVTSGVRRGATDRQASTMAHAAKAYSAIRRMQIDIDRMEEEGREEEAASVASARVCAELEGTRATLNRHLMEVEAELRMTRHIPGETGGMPLDALRDLQMEISRGRSTGSQWYVDGVQAQVAKSARVADIRTFERHEVSSVPCQGQRFGGAPVLRVGRGASAAQQEDSLLHAGPGMLQLVRSISPVRSTG